MEARARQTQEDTGEGNGKKQRPSKAERRQRALGRKAQEQAKRNAEWEVEKLKLQAEREKSDAIEARSKEIRKYLAGLDFIQNQEHEEGPSSLLLAKLQDDALLLRIFSYLSSPRDLGLSVAGVCRRFWKLSVANELWQPLTLQRWPELAHATEIDDWQSLLHRKHREDSKYGDLLTQDLAHCDWYLCPNGHPYLIGECRMPMKTAKCAVCKEPIGGKAHQMLATNERLGPVAAGDYRRKKGNANVITPGVDPMMRLSELDLSSYH